MVMAYGHLRASVRPPYKTDNNQLHKDLHKLKKSQINARQDELAAVITLYQEKVVGETIPKCIGCGISDWLFSASCPICPSLVSESWKHCYGCSLRKRRPTCDHSETVTSVTVHRLPKLTAKQAELRSAAYGTLLKAGSPPSKRPANGNRGSTNPRAHSVVGASTFPIHITAPIFQSSSASSATITTRVPNLITESNGGLTNGPNVVISSASPSHGNNFEMIAAPSNSCNPFFPLDDSDDETTSGQVDSIPTRSSLTAVPPTSANLLPSSISVPTTNLHSTPSYKQVRRGLCTAWDLNQLSPAVDPTCTSRIQNNCEFQSNVRNTEHAANDRIDAIIENQRQLLVNQQTIDSKLNNLIDLFAKYVDANSVNEDLMPVTDFQNQNYSANYSFNANSGQVGNFETVGAYNEINENYVENDFLENNFENLMFNQNIVTGGNIEHSFTNVIEPGEQGATGIPVPAGGELANLDTDTRSALALKVLRETFPNEADLVGHNCSGTRGKLKLDCIKLENIKRTVLARKPLKGSETEEKAWRPCRKAIDLYLRRISKKTNS